MFLRERGFQVRTGEQGQARARQTMNRLQLFREILSMYRKHGWQLRRALMRAETRAELGGSPGGDEHRPVFFEHTPRHHILRTADLAQTQPAPFESLLKSGLKG